MPKREITVTLKLSFNPDDIDPVVLDDNNFLSEIYDSVQQIMDDGVTFLDEDFCSLGLPESVLVLQVEDNETGDVVLG